VFEYDLSLPIDFEELSTVTKDCYTVRDVSYLSPYGFLQFFLYAIKGTLLGLAPNRNNGSVVCCSLHQFGIVPTKLNNCITIVVYYCIELGSSSRCL
jgi:hypothetical protein